MRNRLSIIVLLAFALPALHDAAAHEAAVPSADDKSPVAVQAPAGMGDSPAGVMRPSDSSASARRQALSGKRSWQESFELKLPFSTAKIQVRSKYEAKGYVLKHEIPLGNPNNVSACVMLWEKGDSKVVVMLRKSDIDRTWFSQGEYKDAK